MYGRKKKNETRVVLVKRFDENGSVEKGSHVSKAENSFLSAFFESLFSGEEDSLESFLKDV